MAAKIATPKVYMVAMILSQKLVYTKNGTRRYQCDLQSLAMDETLSSGNLAGRMWQVSSDFAAVHTFVVER